jgi:Phage tail lysozyme
MSDRVFTPALIAGAPAAPAGPPAFDMPPSRTRSYEPARGAWVIRRMMADPRLGITNVIHPAAGVGNLAGESRLTVIQEVNPLSGRGGWGWEQATGDRRVALEDFGASRGDPGAQTDETNYLFFVSELLGPERHAWQQTKLTTDLADATETFERLFERPSSLSDAPARTRYAQQAIDAMGDVSGQQQPAPGVVLAIVLAIKGLQAALKPYGYVGAIDGDWGDGTEAAWQKYMDGTG